MRALRGAQIYMAKALLFFVRFLDDPDWCCLLAGYATALAVACGCLACGKRAKRAFGEPLSFHSKGVIEAGSVVFPSDCGGQLDKRLFGEFFPEPREKGIENFHRSLRHGIRVFQDELLAVGEEVAGAEIRQVREFLGGEAVGSADRRTDVDSKGATNQHCDAQLREILEGRLQCATGNQGLLHLAIAPKEFCMMCDNLYGHDDPADLAFGKRIDEPREKSAKQSLLAGISA